MGQRMFNQDVMKIKIMYTVVTLQIAETPLVKIYNDNFEKVRKTARTGGRSQRSFPDH